MPPALNLCNIQKLKFASLVHGGRQEELESLLDFARLGVEEGNEGLGFGGKVGGHIFHVILWLAVDSLQDTLAGVSPR
jgi:hypothetical protein